MNVFYSKWLILPTFNYKFLCSQVDEEQIWSAKVDLETALTNFSFKSGDTSLELVDVTFPGGRVTVAVEGAMWKIQPFNEHHVKIFNQLGIGLHHLFYFLKYFFIFYKKTYF